MAAYSGVMVDLGEELRARGKRLTSGRVRVLEAVRASGHASAERIAEVLATDGGPPLSLSTVYRSLDALQELGLVGHTHVDHRAPDYHLASHATHVHLACRGCGGVEEVEARVGEAFGAAVLADTGFRVDLTHAAVHGLCRACADGGAVR